MIGFDTEDTQTATVDQLEAFLDDARQHQEDRLEKLEALQDRARRHRDRIDDRLELRGIEEDPDLSPKRAALQDRIDRFETEIERCRNRRRLVYRGLTLVDRVRLLDDDCIERWLGPLDAELSLDTVDSVEEVKAVVSVLEFLVSKCGPGGGATPTGMSAPGDSCASESEAVAAVDPESVAPGDGVDETAETPGESSPGTATAPERPAGPSESAESECAELDMGARDTERAAGGADDDTLSGLPDELDRSDTGGDH